MVRTLPWTNLKCEMVTPAFLMDAFDVFQNSCLPGRPRPTCAFSVVRTDTGRFFVFRSQRGRHSEELAIDRLRQMVQPYPASITWYVSFSPCRSCSDQITAFLSYIYRWIWPGVHVQLIFPSFYRIRRPSAMGQTCSIPWQHHQQNLTGLQNLRQVGVTLRTFEDKDWYDLARLLSVNNFVLRPDRQLEDLKMRADLTRLGLSSAACT